jgi:hypothetical protein
VPQCSRTELASDEAYVSLHDVASEPWLPTTMTLMALVVRGEARTVLRPEQSVLRVAELESV